MPSMSEGKNNSNYLGNEAITIFFYTFGMLGQKNLVGVAEFESTTSSSRTKRASQTALHPDTIKR